MYQKQGFGKLIKEKKSLLSQQPVQASTSLSSIMEQFLRNPHEDYTISCGSPDSNIDGGNQATFDDWIASQSQHNRKSTGFPSKRKMELPPSLAKFSSKKSEK